MGRTSFVVFSSKVLGSVLGFVATIYFARTLGAEVWGYYAAVLALVSWLKLGGELGVAKAVTKRISEGEEQDAFFVAGLVTVFAFGSILALAVTVFAGPLNAYVGREVAPFVSALILTGLFVQLTKATLRGERRVHISGLLEPVQITLRSGAQILLVVVGFGLSGLLFGYVVGGVLVGCVGLYLLTVGYARPRRRHFVELYDYAKYSWFSGLKTRSFNDVDILVLTAFVSSSLVGIYAIAWSIAKFLTLFGSSISATVFPELSRSQATDDERMIATHVENAIRYGGLTTIPGLFGGIVIADRLLLIYGEEFVQGTAVLGILILSTVFNSYLKQFLTGLNGIDRPDIAFRINVVFMSVNLLLNVILVWTFGWIGAAVATMLSVALGAAYSLVKIRRLVEFRIPARELANQIAAALVMAGTVYGSQTVVERVEPAVQNAVVVCLLVAVGAFVYFVALLLISPRFRTTVETNLPFEFGLDRD